MNKPLKITRIGNSAGVILPKHYLEHLGAVVGDRVTVARTARGLELSKAPDDVADTDHQMVVARGVMERRYHALLAIANEIMDQDQSILAAMAKP